MVQNSLCRTVSCATLTSQVTFYYALFEYALIVSSIVSIAHVHFYCECQTEQISLQMMQLSYFITVFDALLCENSDRKKCFYANVGAIIGRFRVLTLCFSPSA